MRRVLLVAVAAMACSQPAGESDWMEREPLSVARSEHPAVVIGDEVVVLGGLVELAPGRAGATASVEAYDPATDTWRDLPELPAPRHHLMAAVADGRLFAIGGYSESGFDSVATVWELGATRWEERAPLPRPIGAGAAVALDGMVYVVGGAPNGGLLRYDPSGDRWDELAPPGADREHLAAVAHDGRIWALAGRWEGEVVASTEAYDPATGTWHDGPDMGEARSGFGAAVVGDSIVVAGGEVFGPDEALASVEVLEGDDWVPGEQLPVGLHGNPLVVFDSDLYVPGGSVQPNGIDNPGALYVLRAELYPNTSTVDAMPSS